MNFRKSLLFLNKHDINPIDTFIANEIEVYKCYKKRGEFEWLCGMVKTLWQKYDNLSVEEIVRAMAIVYERGKEVSFYTLMKELDLV